MPDGRRADADACTPRTDPQRDRTLPTEEPAAEIPTHPIRGWLLLAMALAPAVLIVGLSPAFVTQDGPAHVYNAHILAESFRAGSPFRDTFAVRWEPLPNWLGALLELALIAVLPPEAADRVATLVPLVGLAASAFWLKRRVAGTRGDGPAALLSALAGLNVAWLFGFTGFLVGACLVPITLGVWWGGRSGFGPRRTGGVAALIVVGYFAHIVSLGLTVGSLVVLAVFTPGPGWRGRLGWTLAAVSPCAVLGGMYRALMSRGGPLAPVWGHLRAPLSLESWREQLGWVDPITLGRKVAFPFVGGDSAWLGLATPAALMAVALLVLVVSGGLGDRERRAWPILSAGLLLGGLITPDTLGATHGNYLPQRVMLMGVVSLAAWVDLDLRRRPVRIGALALLAVALGLQTLTVLDYARESSERAGPFLRARGQIGTGRRIGTGLVSIRGRFRSNPLLHADNWLGVGTGNVVWSDYEVRHYYFPVQVRAGVPHPPSQAFEDFALMADPARSGDRARLLSDLLERHHAEIDLWVAWGRDARVDAIVARWFDPRPIYEDGPLRVMRHR